MLTMNDMMTGETETDFTIRSETVVFIGNSKQNLHESTNPKGSGDVDAPYGQRKDSTNSVTQTV
jgi:hypothetical protein